MNIMAKRQERRNAGSHGAGAVAESSYLIHKLQGELREGEGERGRRRWKKRERERELTESDVGI